MRKKIRKTKEKDWRVTRRAGSVSEWEKEREKKRGSLLAMTDLYSTVNVWPSNTNTHAHARTNTYIHTPYLSSTVKCFYSITPALSFWQQKHTHMHARTHACTHASLYTHSTTECICRRARVWESMSVAMVTVPSSFSLSHCLCLSPILSYDDQICVLVILNQ